MLDLTRFDEFYTQGRITRLEWTGTDTQGRKTACLLAAIFPEVAKKKSADACPAGAMWPWLAHLTPWIDDAGSDEKWPEVIKRYAAILHKLHLLDDAAGERLEAKAKIAALDEAVKHFDAGKYPDVAAAITGVRALLVRQSQNDKPSRDEFKAAQAAAEAVAVAASPARAAAWAAARAARAAARAAAWAAVAGGADRIIDAILSNFEAEITAAGG